MELSDQKYLNKWIKLDSQTTNGAFTEPSDGRVYDTKKLIEIATKLGRPLTEEEAAPYRLR